MTDDTKAAQSISMWQRPQPGSRRPRFTREQIAQTAIEIADREGISAVSMRRIASELGAGAMTLYHYVHTKNELISLMGDAIMGEFVVPEGELSSNWREALTQIAQRSKASLLRHPWSIDGLKGAESGPNSLRHLEQSVAAVSQTNLDGRGRIELITLIDDYVIGFVSRYRMVEQSARDPEELEAWFTHARDYMSTQFQSGDYPHMQELLTQGSSDEIWQGWLDVMFDEERFARGLERLFDGVALEMKEN